MRNLLWKDYIGAMASDDSPEYYIKLYGDIESASRIVEYHLQEKETNGLDGIFTLIDSIDDMVFGQFISAERALSSGLKPHDALYNLSLSVIRPYDDKEYDNVDRDKEIKHKEELDNSDAAEVLAEIERYTEMRDEFVKVKYEGVFYLNNENEDSDDDSDNTEDETMEENFSKNWYWYNIVRVLANEDIFKYEDVYMLPMSMVAPELAFKRHRNIVEEIQRKRNEMLK